MRKAVPAPAAAITKPASPGPTARAKLNSMPLRADAAGRSSFLTRSGKTARHDGVSNASPADRAKVRIRSASGPINPPMVSTASRSATPAIQDHHEPGSARALHKRADIRNDVGDDQISKVGD